MRYINLRFTYLLTFQRDSVCFIAVCFTQEVSGSRTKLDSLVDFPVTEGLDLSAFIDANNNHRCLAGSTELASVEQKLSACSQSHVYDLYAVCRHSGSLQSGHYTG